ncbi:PREDICTED: protein zwilch homolog [Branchiostoma belcheri]|uniref:Protein zwilch n=1 Tax=Branchiostoma belcheri TaxID=7741 RepID=A0A6P4YZI6_BRABE|nr:PREDICTED: protein zwilch homolog [Branchiostoma belcheri]
MPAAVMVPMIPEEENQVETDKCDLETLLQRLKCGKSGDSELFKEEFRIQLLPQSQHPLCNMVDRKAQNDSIYLLQRELQVPLEQLTSESLDGVLDVDSLAGRVETDGEDSTRDDSMEDTPKIVAELHPVSVKEARYFLSLYAMAHNPAVADAQPAVFPLWVKVEVLSSRERVCYMGSELHTNRRGQVTGMSTYTVTAKGPFPTPANLPTLEALQKKHRATVFPPNNNVVNRGFVQYDVFGTGSQDAAGERQTSVLIECGWKDVTSVLQLPPYNSDTVMHIRAVPGDMKSAAYSIYRELQTLTGFVEGLQTGEVLWCQEENAVPLTTTVRSFIEEFTDLHVKKPALQKVQNESDINSPMHSMLLPPRKDLDFTEALWEKLLGCSGYQELVDCLQLVLAALQQGKIQPMVHRSNQSELACLVRESFKGTMRPPDLDGSLPVRLLAEIGIEKMKRDYTHFFIAEELTTLSQLSAYLKTDASLEDNLALLHKLHVILEMVAACKAFLNLPHENLRTLLGMALQHYGNHHHDDGHTFRLPLSAGACIKKVYERSQAAVWRLEQTSGGKDDQVTSVCQISTRPPYEHAVCALEDMTLGDPAADTQPYYLTTVQQSRVHFT